MKGKKKIVRYAAGIDATKSTDGVKVPKWRSEKIGSDYVKVYSGTFRALLAVSPAARIVLDCAVIQMDGSNFVANDALFKTCLKDAMDSRGVKSYSGNTINRAFSELCSNGIMVKQTTEGRGIYRINPIFFFKGSEVDRIDLIRKIKEIPFYKENTEMREDYYLSR